MGEIEKQVQKEVRRTRINSAIIKTLAGAGMLAMVLMAPNVLQVLGQFGFINPRQKKYNISKSLARLIECGYVKVEGKGTEKTVQLTSKGEQFAALLGEGRLAPKKPKRWDKKWRLLIFDIPERRKKLREQLRMTLTDLGFVRLQDSAWVYPYDCEDIIALVKIDSHIGRDIRYIVADHIEGDGPLRRQFGLN